MDPSALTPRFQNQLSLDSQTPTYLAAGLNGTIKRVIINTLIIIAKYKIIQNRLRRMYIVVRTYITCLLCSLFKLKLQHISKV